MTPLFLCPILKSVQPKDIAEIREAFAKTMAVRNLIPRRSNWPTHIFLNPWCEFIDPEKEFRIQGSKRPVPLNGWIAMADLALANGNVDGLAKAIATYTEEGIRKRFEHALETKKHARESVNRRPKLIRS